MDGTITTETLNPMEREGVLGLSPFRLASTGTEPISLGIQHNGSKNPEAPRLDPNSLPGPTLDQNGPSRHRQAQAPSDQS